MTLTGFALADNVGVFANFFANKFNSYLGRISMFVYIIHYDIIHCGGRELSTKLSEVYKHGLWLGIAIILIITMVMAILYDIYNRKKVNRRITVTNSNVDGQ